MRRAHIGLALWVLGGLFAPGCGADDSGGPRTVTLWHAYRGAEEQALGEVVERFNRDHPEIHLESLAIPYESFASKLSTTIPRGNGPDVFIFAHERIGGWSRTQLIEPLDALVPPESLRAFFPETLAALRFDGALYGLPMAFKCLALFHNRALMARPPATTDALLETAAALRAQGKLAIAFTNNFYFHAPWFFGFGARLFPESGGLGFASPEAIESLRFINQLAKQEYMPAEPTGAVVTDLFNRGELASVVSGPWFLGEIAAGLDFGVAPLPVVSKTGQRASPFLTSEGVLVSRRARNKTDAVLVAMTLAGAQSAAVRAFVGKQMVSHSGPWNDPRLKDDAVAQAFRAQLGATEPMDSRPRMVNAWEPADLALRQVLRGVDAEDAAQAAEDRYAAITPPAPRPANALPYLLLAGVALLAGLALLVRWISDVRRRREGRAAVQGWRWIGPAMVATVVLIFVPFGVGLVLAFFSHREGTYTFVGLSNFADILGATGYALFEPLSFYYALAVTVLWTAANLVLHVGFGLSLALLLNRPAMRLKPVYRVLLILPWAVPNYITALMWKGLFNKQYGAINAILESLGLDGVAWFSSFGTAFFANLCANAWLGFPFMMVVCLGALQSIPGDLYDAAAVDGAAWWQKLRHVTFPLLVPALVPAVLLGTVWTFNQFNIVYLVSGGEPDNSTDILISEAYRWAFTRQERYGYAAAYAALIFVILLGWSWMSARIARAAERAA